MFKPSLLIATIALATACSGPGSSDAVSVASRTESTMNITEGQPMATADLGISGMTCEMMCGGMIKSALVKVPGVETTEIVFHDGDAIGHAKVTYDPTKVDDSMLVLAVQALADGQYKVESIAVVKQVKSAASVKQPSEKEEDDVSVSIMPEVAMPNLVSTLLALVRI
ncbi:MAG: hypothetical protein IPO60_04485 [Flavobacteriales bacterium]|jgi:copper chaperone CopZ|nr:hypothetical protein [Flavobacteriales bacterium]MBK6892420.1 hypothetical protein [Flavobacteriales bacterium]MBK7246558.1 hypothetical protein [Flavobacteriales bacterium]MBK9060737.1 hypothetical protein [Flavobacteriales bacterium]MBK9597592.1 hypothetical protein [Flavobacteriales bacterium]